MYICHQLNMKKLCIIFIHVFEVVFCLVEFKESQTYLEDNYGRELKFSTTGTLRNIIDLDDKTTVQRVLCNDRLIKVSLTNTNESLHWDVGHIVIGSVSLGCQLNPSTNSGILAKVVSIEIKRRHLLYLLTEDAGPLDIIESATVSAHVVHKRSKRSNSNFLSNILDSINWNETAETPVYFNKERHVIASVKRKRSPTPLTYLHNPGEIQDETDVEFNFTCASCVGELRLSYHLEMKIHRDLANNDPVVKTYISQIEGESDNSYDFSITSLSELTISTVQRIFSNEPTIYHNITLATFKRFPKIELAIQVESATYLSLDATTQSSEPLLIQNKFNTSGNFVISNIYNNNTNQSSDHVSTYNWKTTYAQNNDVIRSNNTFSVKVNISHTINVRPLISWAERDILMTFGAPFDIRLEQIIDMKTYTTDIALCSQMRATNRGLFYSGKNSLLINVFGIEKWKQVATLTESKKTSSILKDDLIFSKCKANCFGTSDFSPNSMDSCGLPQTVIHRDSSQFSLLRKLFGNTMLFKSEEVKESSWCGKPGTACVDCNDYVRDDDVCADRYVTATLAEVLTKLAKFVATEWPNRKLVVIEAWDEPTSKYPDGSHGNSSLFYTGRAARVGVSQSLSSTDAETNPTIYARFSELLQCSGFDSFVPYVKDSIVDVCVADESATVFENARKKRKRRAVKSNNIAVRNDWREEKDVFVGKLVGSGGTRIMGSNTKDYFKTYNSYPKGRSAESVCSPPDEDYSRENVETMQRLMQYPFDNVYFLPEGPSSSSCGTATRQCSSCTEYIDSDDPWDWCGSRIMTPRAVARLNRLAKLIKHETDSAIGKRSVPGWTQEEIGVCRSGVVSYQDVTECEQVMPVSADRKSKCAECVMNTRCCYADKVGCMRSDCSGTASTSVWTRVTCSEVNPFGTNANIPTSPKCNANDQSKMILFENVCSGDPCQFFTGREYYLLLKIVMIFEVCSGKWNEDTIALDLKNPNIADKDLLEFFDSCMSNDHTVLRIHRVKENDPTIGIGYSLKEINGKTEKKDFLLKVLPNIDYDGIMDGSASISKQQALYLYAVVMRQYIRSINSVVPFEDFVHLSTNLKIALVNANYRGEFGQKRRVINTAVRNGEWDKAKAAYLSHTDYTTNYKCGSGSKNSVCTRMNWNAKQFNEKIVKQVKVEKSDGNFRGKRQASTSGSITVLQTAGRAFKISVNSGTVLSTAKLANLAVLAGFDHVSREATHVNVCVRPVNGFTSVIMYYPKLNMHAAEPPAQEVMEYDIPADANYNLDYPLLLDGYNDTIQLSDCYKISDIKSKEKRYFRFDSNLLECLEDASSSIESCIKIIPGSGYRVRSHNNKNIESRNTEEKWRFSVGQAAEIKHKDLKLLSLTIARSCIPKLIPKRLKLGIGAHPDRLYIDVREIETSGDYIKVWNSGSESLYRYIKDIREGLLKGGPFVDPTNKTRACTKPDIGSSAFYIKYPGGSCSSDSGASTACTNTRSNRQGVAEDLTKMLFEVTGNGQLDKQTLRGKVEGCIVDLCGGCIGKGSMWLQKLTACYDLAITFLKASSSPFPSLHNSAAFYNTENSKSEVHSLACHDRNQCIENVQLHSFLQEILFRKYKPDATKTNEELIFDPADNPSPLLSLIEQIMAMRVSGNVSVYIENNADVPKMEHLLKIIMVYNKNVSSVHFHLTKTVRKAQVLSSLQRKIERWSMSVCPDRSRMLIAPFDFFSVSDSRHKRSIEKSKDRNLSKHSKLNWELEWLSQM